MSNSAIHAVLGLAVTLGALSASSAMAADLIVRVDASKRYVSVTNTLPTKLTLLYLKAPDDSANLPVYAKLARGATVAVPLRFAMPDGVIDGVADVGGQQRDVSVAVVLK